MFGKRIAEIRESMGLSQGEASKLLDIPQSTYSGYELGSRKIPLSMIKKISDLYNVSVDSLLDNEINTIAAHKDGEDWTAEELEDIENFKKYILSKRNK